MARVLEHPLYAALNIQLNRRSLEPTRRAAIYGWLRGDYRVSPPATAKQRHLRDVFESRGHRIFVEAGTYKGATTAYMADYADQVFSVELHEGLFAEVQQRLGANPKITLICGDSTVEVPKIVAGCATPPLIFLDGHFSGPGTAEGDESEPAGSTLQRLADVTPAGSTIIVDDLRQFGTKERIPQLDEIALAARSAFPSALIRAGLDSIVIET
ncbi:hypothetical protein [Mycobacterium sp. E1747]|uniref:hypothetical protein n=1 Tax=Mycobacterium sp. E1747 TaxID=1834128 RepID=UPI0007FF4D1F|nr:hypothetical protein [Mycobacterium sp. E1747]OBH10100.1 hypothetical protein A5695_22945 [Mycobacterium sp. E1747]